MKHWGNLCLLLLIVAGGVAAERDVRSHGRPFVLMEQHANGWDIRYEPTEQLFPTLVIERETYTRFLTPSTEEAREGSPALPSDVLLLGLPFGARIDVQMTDEEFALEGNRRVAPHPAYQFTDDNDAIEVFQKDQAAYARNEFVPRTSISVEKPFILREQYVAVVRIHPYQYNPATATLRRIVRATLRVRFSLSQSKDRAEGAPSNDPQFEQTYKALVWNYEQAKQWRRRIVGRDHLLVPTDSTRLWFETGRTYFKIPIAADGWYRVTRADLLAAGADLNTVDLPSLKLFWRGREVPIVVRPDTSIEFYGLRNRGDSTFIDYYTDTSAYWLTWGGVPGARFASDSVQGVPAATIGSALTTLHVEENRGYFAGSSNTNEPIDIHTTPGETWYWQWFSINNEFTFPFTLDSLDSSVPVCTLRVRLWGTTYTTSLPPQRARFWVNDSLAGEVNFGTRQAALFTAAIPVQWLRPGTNSLRILNVNLGFGNTQFYLDWFEIDYPRRLRAVNDQLVFVTPDALGGTPQQFVVSGFSSPAIEVFDLSSRRRLGGTTVSGDSISGFTVSFLDTLSSARTYVVKAAARSIPFLRSKTFTDIRVNPPGADYIVITHPAFRTQAEQLAAQRQAVRGVRTRVVDVEEIYDEFNYGVMNATKLKTFIRYAYDHWAQPAPAYVLLFGDASWDYHRYFGSASIKTNYVPAYGYPAADNWFVCFDSTYSFLPSMYIGRIPCENPTQAQIAVAKVIAYDGLPLDEWCKKFLFITGGVDPSEQQTFNYLAENTISTHITPAPLGGVPVRVYKSTPGYIDGENKALLQSIFREGISFVSFTGHSGGRVWGVTPGHPSELQNTDGRWPFISSVTCNVGGFSTPQNSVLAEDFLFADSRGAIASWASVSVGYVTYGWLLNSYWLASAREDSVREFGKLTTNAALRLWAVIGSGGITIAMINLNPLIGDPLSRFPLPTKPDLTVRSADIGLTLPYPTPNDSMLSVRVMINNYGTVSPDSVGVTVADLYNGTTRYLVNNRKLPPTSFRDSLFILWNGRTQVGPHTLTASLDPTDSIQEANELNNIATNDQYVYANNLYVVRPLNNMVVPSGVQRLVVTSPIGYDSSGFNYYFELDTVDTFDSPALVVSGRILPDNAKGEWLTPSLPGDRLYFWRVRTMHKALAGNWVTSAFITSTDLPAGQKVRVRESMQQQFARDVAVNTQPSDSGVTLRPSVPLSMYVRSVGFRYNQTLEYYSTVKANEQYAIGYWWELGSSFMVMRVNDFTGSFTFKSFNVASNPALSDSMKDFINATPAGHYIGIAVIFDGQSNVRESLRLTMDTLGATLFRSIGYGQSYAFLGRKGNGAPGMVPLERLTNDTAVVSLTVPNYFSIGSGSITSHATPIAAAWDSLHWRSAGDAALTNIRLALLGIRSAGGVDTLLILPRDSADVSLAWLDSVTAAQHYSAWKTAALLETADASYTPRLTAWWVDFTPPADLAVSARTLGQTQAAAFPFPITVHNIGYKTSDSVSVKVYALDYLNNARLIAETVLDSIPVEGSRTATVSISTAGYGYRMLLRVVVSPLHHGADLVEENNVAYYTLYKKGVAPPIFQVYSDGKLLMDGDYVPPKPIILVKVPPEERTPAFAAAHMDLYVNDTKVEQATSVLSKSAGERNASVEETFSPSLSPGRHALRFRLALLNTRGEVDTLERTLHVQVAGETKIVETYTYPNPFPKDTYFTFVLAGAGVPEEVRIRIYTVAGRRIRDLEVPSSMLRIGFNQVYWDGRDADGDEIANGYYFYEVIARHEGKTHSVLQKLAKLR
jgi:hypothetical protein